MLLTRQFRRQSKTWGRNGWWRRCGWRGEDAEEEIADLIHDTSRTMRSWRLTNRGMIVIFDFPFARKTEAHKPIDHALRHSLQLLLVGWYSQKVVGSSDHDHAGYGLHSLSEVFEIIASALTSVLAQNKQGLKNRGRNQKTDSVPKTFFMISQLFFDSYYWLVPQNQRWSL